MTLFDRNLEFIRGSSKMLHDTITKEEALITVNEIRSIDNSNFEVSYSDMTCKMHSIRNQNNEMMNMFKHAKGKEEIIILFGIGNGAALRYIGNNYSTVKKIIVVEPSLDLFKHYLTISNMKIDVMNLSVSFLINKSPEFSGLEIGRYIGTNNQVIVHHVTSKTLFSSYYSTMLHSAKDTIIKRMGNYNFQQNVNQLINLNVLTNIDYGYIDVNILKNLMKDKPLLIVAAGPSLNKNMHLINEAKKYAIVIAVGSAIKILDSNNIVPHFRMAFDPSVAELSIVTNTDTSAAPIIYSNTLFCDILPSYLGNKICVNITSDYMQRLFNIKKGIEVDHIATGSTIVISAAHMGVVFGSSKIVFIGFDSAITADSIYAKGIGKDRESGESEFFKAEHLREDVDIYGNVVYTNRGYYMNKIGIESIIKNSPNVEFIEATEGGLKKEGTIIKTLADVIKEDFHVEYDLNNLSEMFDINLEVIDNHKKDVIRFLEVVLVEIKEVEVLNNVRIKQLKKLNKYNLKGIKKDFVDMEIKRLFKVEEEWFEIDTYKWYVYPSLESIIDALKTIHRYVGFDKVEKNTANIKLLLGVSANIDEFIQLVKSMLISKFKNKLRESYTITENHN